MEVHHHSHTARKKWTHYFWEFLMLFLAVFCGFLAEYQLEHFIEKQRAKEFAHSLHRDLVGDTTSITQINDRLKRSISDIDSLILLLDSSVDLKKNTQKAYEYSINAFGSPQYQPNESTLQQLLNSGSLRYFKNSMLVDTIKYYNNIIQRNSEFAKSAHEFNLEFRKVQMQVVKISLLSKAIFSGSNLNERGEINQSNYDNSIFADETFLTYDSSNIKQYSNWCAFKKFYFVNTLSRNISQKTVATVLLKLLTNTYNIK